MNRAHEILNELLNKIYHDPLQGFVSQKKLYTKAKELNSKITHKLVANFLKQNSTQQQFTIQKVKHNFPIKSYEPFSRLQIDLLSFENERGIDRNTFCFVCIDVYTRFAMVVPIKSKNESLVLML